jgi:hypothetical protein
VEVLGDGITFDTMPGKTKRESSDQLHIGTGSPANKVESSMIMSPHLHVKTVYLLFVENKYRRERLAIGGGAFRC